MNNFRFYILFLFTLSAFAQAEIIDANPPEASGFTIHIDEDSVIQKSFRENFQNDYKSKDFMYETIAPKQTSKWESFKAWLRNWLDKIFSFGDNSNSSTLDIFIKILAIAVVLFVVYLIVKALLDKEGGWIFGKSSKKKIRVSEHLEEDIHSIDFKSMIDKNKADNNYRLTIRYYYLWLLKKMSDSHVIEWDIEKTNSDYLYEIQRAALKDNFQYLSYIYDHCWYGEFALDHTSFAKAEKAFISTINSI
ncbi:DUF4129 domain-containing protein [Flavobacterium sp.]|uniref:DUF4129 domain-containing protein n=1 Tax=Flavobacterium sp. TaxID=239 RepID=UPI0028BE7705|nr:DUF4129 domain-containing protein [Flavobacterium sp.]